MGYIGVVSFSESKSMSLSKNIEFKVWIHLPWTDTVTHCLHSPKRTLLYSALSLRTWFFTGHLSNRGVPVDKRIPLCKTVVFTLHCSVPPPTSASFKRPRIHKYDQLVKSLYFFEVSMIAKILSVLDGIVKQGHSCSYVSLTAIRIPPAITTLCH